MEQRGAGALFPGVVAGRRQKAMLSDLIPSEYDVEVEENSNFLRVLD